MTPEFLTAFDALPSGTFRARFRGRPYVVTRQDFSGGKSQKLVAHELGGSDYISMNLYRLDSGVRLKPCEMPAEKVMHFVLDLTIPTTPEV